MNELKEWEIKTSIADGLKKVRSDKGVSQRVVLYDTGIHIARIEANIKSLTVVTLKRVCSYYGITLQDFFTKYCNM